jgi:osmotically-inducible protein OsmY
MRFKLKTVVGAGLAGAAAMWLYDPDYGAKRRHQLQDMLRSKAHKGQREIERKIRHERGKLEGVVHKINHGGYQPTDDDHVLVDRIKSEILGKEHYSTHEILVEAHDGVVVLRGQLDDPVARLELENEVAAMPGVDHVESLLHATGEDPPNKAAALHATER